MDIHSQQSGGGNDQEIIIALGLEGASPDMAAQVVAQFGRVLFKKLLLLLPDALAKNVVDEITALPLQEGMERLVALLDKHVPDASARRARVLEETIAEFRADPQGA